MKLALTGIDTLMGAALSRGLADKYQVVPLRGDLLQAEVVKGSLAGTEAVVHAVPHQPGSATEPSAEAALLDRVGRGTFVLVNAAVELGLRRMVLVSQIELMAAHPENYVVRPFWRPHPSADAQGLAPYLAELTSREIARMGKIEVVCLRMGPLGAGQDQTTAEDAVAGVTSALGAESLERGHSWSVRHVVSRGRFLG